MGGGGLSSLILPAAAIGGVAAGGGLPLLFPGIAGAAGAGGGAMSAMAGPTLAGASAIPAAMPAISALQAAAVPGSMGFGSALSGMGNVLGGMGDSMSMLDTLGVNPLDQGDPNQMMAMASPMPQMQLGPQGGGGSIGSSAPQYGVVRGAGTTRQYSDEDLRRLAMQMQLRGANQAPFGFGSFNTQTESLS